MCMHALARYTRLYAVQGHRRAALAECKVAKRTTENVCYTYHSKLKCLGADFCRRPKQKRCPCGGPCCAA
jgi:hypothetical protein